MNISRREWFAAAAAGIAGAADVAIDGDAADAAAATPFADDAIIAEPLLHGEVSPPFAVPYSWIIPAEYCTTPDGRSYLRVTGYPHSPQAVMLPKDLEFSHGKQDAQT